MKNNIFKLFFLKPGRDFRLTSYVVFILTLSSCAQLIPNKQKKQNLAVEQLQNLQRTEATKTDQPLVEITDQQILETLLIDDAELFRISEERFDVAVNDVGINEFLLGLVDSTEYNVIVSPNLNIKISLHLKNVTLSEVLHALTQIYPVAVKQNGRTYLISSSETMTAIYSVDYLNIQRKGDSKTRVAGQSISTGKGSSNQKNTSNQSSISNNSKGSSNISQSNSSNVETKSETDFWKDLAASLNLMVQNEEKASVVVSPHAGLVVVRSLPKTHQLIKKYLKKTQKSLNRQVIIEAKIIEVQLNEGFQSGVDWSRIGSTNGNVFTLSQRGQVFSQPISDRPIEGVFSFLYNGNSFTAAIELLKSQGDVQVLSSPRVSTVNNQKAIIKVGSDEFFVTDISTTTVTGTSTSTTPNVTLTPFFSGISLDVTPQINQQGDIILHIHPTVSEVTDQPKTLSLGEDQFVLPLALTNIRESDSIVKAKNGQVIVIGGLMQNSISEEKTSTPLLGDIPLLGNLFKQTRQRQVKSELVILLKTHLVDAQQTRKQLQQIKKRFIEF